MTSYIEYDDYYFNLIYGEVVMSCSEWHNLGDVPEVIGSNPELEKIKFFQDHLQT